MALSCSFASSDQTFLQLLTAEEKDMLKKLEQEAKDDKDCTIM